LPLIVAQGRTVFVTARPPIAANLLGQFWRKTLRLLDRIQPLGLLALRVVVGVIMIGHGYGKVFHGGLAQHVAHVSSMGLPGWLAYPSAYAEFFGGILLIAGLFTRFVSLAVMIDMLVAIWKVHWKNGMFGRGGYEFPLTLATIAFALIFFGAGPIAIDAIRGAGKSFKAKA
jgi:putative oxidoreductase